MKKNLGPWKLLVQMIQNLLCECVFWVLFVTIAFKMYNAVPTMFSTQDQIFRKQNIY